MALQLTVFPLELSDVPEPNVFRFDTLGVPLGRIANSGGGPVVITRKRHRKKPRIWTDGELPARRSITGSYDVKRNGHEALQALYNIRDAKVPVVLFQPRGDTRVDRRRWLVEKVEERHDDWFESTAQEVDYTVVLLEVSD